MFRIGYGTDVHAFVTHRPLVVGGITIPFAKGLDGHSDADVLIHAICDALLGALALGDIGHWFPDNDPKYKNIDSCLLLAEVIAAVEKKGYKIGNIDATILAQTPKMSPHLPAMIEKLAQVMHTDQTRINIKATTTEGLGFVGQQLGIEARAICLLELSEKP